MTDSAKNTTSTIETDALVIGAGPAGLFAAFELGVVGLQAHIIEALPYAGGQCTELYGDKPIYDIPAIKQCTGSELADRLLAQLKPFNVNVHLQQTVTVLKQLHTTASGADHEDAYFDVQTSDGLHFLARCVILASGAGAFLPRTLALEGLAAFKEQQVFHHFLPAQEKHFKGQHIVIHGDTETALQAANRLASLTDEKPASVTLVHRRDKFRAPDDVIIQAQQLRSTTKLQFIAGQFTSLVKDEDTDRLKALELIRSADGQSQQIPADTFFILLGLAPQLGPIEQWGLALERKRLIVDAATFQTNVPGIFAIGDAVAYLGKRKLIVSAFHEAALAAYAAASHLQGGAEVPVYYTSSNSNLLAIFAPERKN